MDQGILITSREKLTPSHRQDHEPYEYFKYLAQSGAGNGCQVSFYELPPQKANYPYHYHALSTEVFYIISGLGTLKTPEGDKPIKAGDVVVCPPGERGAHKLVNTSQIETLFYLDVDTAHGADAAFYPDSGKVGVLVDGQPGAFFRREDETVYYDGE